MASQGPAHLAKSLLAEITVNVDNYRVNHIQLLLRPGFLENNSHSSLVL